jgi:hypothetical protein
MRQESPLTEPEQRAVDEMTAAARRLARAGGLFSLRRFATALARTAEQLEREGVAAPEEHGR